MERDIRALKEEVGIKTPEKEPPVPPQPVPLKKKVALKKASNET